MEILLQKEEKELLKELLEKFDPLVLLRGHTYHEAQHIRDIQKDGPELTARIRGSYGLYQVMLDLEDGTHSCNCPARPPCKHIACLIIWTLEQPSENLSNPAFPSLSPRNSCDLVCILNVERNRVSLHSQNAQGKLTAIESKRELNRLKPKWQKIIENFLDAHSFYQYSYHYTENLELPLYKLIDSFHKEGLSVPVYYDDIIMKFGGFLELNALVCDSQLGGELNRSTEYSVILYYYDPHGKVYREADPILSIEQFDMSSIYMEPYWKRKRWNAGYAVFLSPAEPTEREKKLHASLSLVDKDQTEKNLGKKNYDSGPDTFYLLKPSQKAEKVLHFEDIRYKYTSISALYYDSKRLEPFMAETVKQHIREAAHEGPAMAISMHAEEKEDNFIIKGKVEIIYAKEKKFLRPQYWRKEKKGVSATEIFGFPPRRLRYYRWNRKILEYNINGDLISRNLGKERKLLEKTDIPFRYRKTTGDFDFSPRFLRKFSEKYLPILQKQKVVMRLHESLWPLLETSGMKSAFKIECVSGIDWFRGEVEIEGVSEKDRKAILQAYYKKQEHLKLSNGSWVLTSAFDLEKIHLFLEELGIRLRKDGTSASFSKGQLIALESMREEELFSIRADKKAQELRNDFQDILHQKRNLSLQLPPSMEKLLRPYQKEGCDFLYRLFHLNVGGILADDMGLGKTLQTLAFITSMTKRYEENWEIEDNETAELLPFLVVGPLAAINVWEEEAHKFTPNLPIQIWHGSRVKKDSPFLESGLVITTYSTLSLNIDYFQEQKFTAVFFDEAQNIKNIQTNSAKAARHLKAKAFFCLTGTPIENHLGELWAVMEVCFPGLLGSKKYYKSLYGSGQDLNVKDRLLARIAPFILRRKKQDVLKELPDKIETVVSLSLHTSQSLIYEKVRQEAIIALRHAGSNYLAVMLPYLMKLRRICCHPDLKNKHIPDLYLSNKFSYLKENLAKIKTSTSGTLIFSQFTDVLDMIGGLLKQEKEDFFYINGSTPSLRRQKMVKAFQCGERHFFLISLKAGGTALTLHRADSIFHLDPWWNPAAETQAADRAHRIGQVRQVFVYKLISKGSIEEKVLRLQSRKKKLFDALFNGGGNTGTVINRKEIVGILEDSPL